jgi:hypothetical protein
MLVLAMEFSRCAQRTYPAGAINQQTDDGEGCVRASGRCHSPKRRGPASRRRAVSPRGAHRARTEGRSLKTE